MSEKHLLTKTQRWLLLPICLILGIALVFAFVTASQKYLSEYLVRNSKTLVGTYIDLQKLATHIEDTRIMGFAKAHSAPSIILSFWSMSCAPCLKDLADLPVLGPETIYVPINTDDEKDLNQAEEVFKGLVPHLPFFYDKDHYLQRNLKIEYLPTHVYLDGQGKIEKFEAGKK